VLLLQGMFHEIFHGIFHGMFHEISHGIFHGICHGIFVARAQVHVPPPTQVPSAPHLCLVITMDQSPAALMASAALPAKAKIRLSLLSPASVKTGGVWDVHICRATEDIYEYKYQGKDRTGTTFICILVSPEDPREYCQAQIKKTSSNGGKYLSVVKACKQGARFEMSAVAFSEDAKAAFVSCPLKKVVNLEKTKMDICIAPLDLAVQPAPTATIAGSVGLGNNQCFDVTALVQEVQDIRQFANNRSAFTVRIYDGSIDKDTQKVKAMQLTWYFDTIPSKSAEQHLTGESWKAFLEEHLQNKTAVSFFCISGSQDNNSKFSFKTTKNTWLAKGAGTKADELNKNAALHNLTAVETTAFEVQPGKAARDWALEPGKETRCKLLASFARSSTGVPEMDDGETVWQLNYVQIAEPTELQNIKSNDGNRLWMPLTMLDETGSVVLYCTEKAALKLANVPDAATFEQHHSEGRLQFPFFNSVKVYRRPSSTQTDTNNNSPTIDCFIVDADEQNMEEVFSACSTKLLPMLGGDSVDGVLPATLGMVNTSEHYNMAVKYTTQEVPQDLQKAARLTQAGVPIMRPCSRVVALVHSTKHSIVSAAGANGHQLVTDDVVDFITASNDAIAPKYRIISFCTLDTVTQFKLNPPGRSKSQAALICVTSVLSEDTDSAGQSVKSLLVDSVQLLTPVEAECVKSMLSKMMYYGALAGQVSRTRERENDPWDKEESPAKASKCRILGRSPTGPALPDYMPSQ
jgi:hypothetical protein